MGLWRDRDDSSAEAHGGPIATGPLPALGTITLELTHRCHRSCAFCYVPPRVSDAVELSAAQFVEGVSRIMNESGCRRVQLSGGEPLLRKDILDIVDGLVENGASVSIITDGAQLDEVLAKALASRGVGPIQPTLLSGSRDLHDAMRGKGAFDSVTRAIAVAASAGLDVSVCMVVTRHNYAEAGSVAELCFALGARGMAISRFTPASAARPAYETLMPTAEHVRRACQSAARVSRTLRVPLAAAIAIPACVFDAEKPVLRVGVCSLMGPKCTITVDPGGGIRSCCLSTLVVGNLLEDSWERVEQRLWEQQLRPMRGAVPPACRGCPHLSRCLGGCRLSAQAIFGDMDHPDPLAPCARAWIGEGDGS